MTKDMKKITELRYRIARHRRMGNGAVCQSLSAELRKLLMDRTD